MTEQIDYGETNFPQDVLKRTKVSFPQDVENTLEGGMILNLLWSVGNRITPWGTGYLTRDIELRDFWPVEPFLAGAIYSTAIRNANYEWEIKGPEERVVKQLTNMLDGSFANNNFGWLPFIQALTQDFLCLAGYTKIRLGGDRLGKTKSIAQIVKDKDPGPVISVDKEGNLVERKIIEWHKTPLGERKWWWISSKNVSGHSKEKRGGLFLTEDHPMLTSAGWKQARDIKVGDLIATGEPIPNQKQMQMLVGGILGDIGVGKIRKRAMLRMSHGINQKEYFDLKVSSLKGFTFTGIKNYVNKEYGNEFISGNSLGTIGLNDIHSRWYPNGKKIVCKEDVEKYFSPRMLAVWYCDDGSFHKSYTSAGNETSPYIMMATHSFSEEENDWLAEFLTRNGIPSHTVPAGDKKQYKQIYITTEGTRELIKLVAPYIPPSMRYKLPEDAEAYNPELWDLGYAKISYDEVVESKQRNYYSGYTINETTYHIGVEETATFIAAGLVSHNTQDNGMFFELVRDPTMDAGSRFKDEKAPVIGLMHLEANRCVRTGKFDKPVIYIDRDQKRHVMKWYQVVGVSQFPSTIQTMNGVGHCAVSRILKFAQIIESMQNYTDEKISGRHVKQIHFVGGVSRLEIEDIKKKGQEDADNMGLRNYIEPLIYASLDPEKPVTTASIDLASLPDNFNFEELMRWYVANIALNMGSDYQDFAPLPSGNIGSSSQSEILARKSQGKGPANWMELIENLFRDYAIIPKPYEFKFKVKDLAEEADKAEMTNKLVQSISILRRADVINGKAARAMLKELDVIPEEIISLVPEDFGNEPTISKTENLLGQVGDSTIGEDAARTEKNLWQRIKGG